MAVLAVGISLCACSGNKEKPPIPLQQMQSIVMDIHTAEIYSRYATKGPTPEREKNMDSLAAYYAAILEHYHISLADYNKAFEWYTLHPDMLDSLYAGIVDTTTQLAKHYPAHSGRMHHETEEALASDMRDSLATSLPERFDSTRLRAPAPPKDTMLQK
jgi:hypothetical protein